MFSTYGHIENETQTIIALIAKIQLGQELFKIWENTKQTEKFRYVDNIVGVLLVVNKSIIDAASIGAGVSKYVSINGVMEVILDYMHRQFPDIDHGRTRRCSSSRDGESAEKSCLVLGTGAQVRVGYQNQSTVIPRIGTATIFMKTYNCCRTRNK